MQPLSLNDKILARRVVTAQGIRPLTLISRDADGVVRCQKFERETAGTVWYNCDVALIHPDKFDEFLMDDLAMLLSCGESLERIYQYLKSSNLLADDNSQAVVLPLRHTV